MINKWIYSELTDEQNEIKNKLANELSISPILAQLHVQRGISNFDEARAFFRPDIGDLHDPY